MVVRLTKDEITFLRARVFDSLSVYESNARAREQLEEDRRYWTAKAQRCRSILQALTIEEQDVKAEPSVQTDGDVHLRS